MPDKVIAEHSIQEAKKLIDSSKRIVIVTHVSPDGDAIGSSLALCRILSQMGKHVDVVVPNNYPSFLKWMNGVKDIIVAEWKEVFAKGVFRAADLIFCLDFNIPKRVQQLAELVENAPAKKIMIDHHPQPGDFCDVTISHPELSSTSELLFRFICALGMYDAIDKNCAECIYTGMMTDTGAFTYNSNSPDIYHIISKLLEKGINKDILYQKVYNNYSESRIRLEGYVLYEKMKIFEDYNAALITLSCEEQQRFQWKKGDTEGFVNIPLSIENIRFSVFIREEENMIKISLRSQGGFPSNQFAADVFNGGGHLNASGGEFYGKLEDAVRLFEEALPRYKEQLTIKN
ncbi:MAG: bifunctional oligoribonuclease/PAP phosphatase NrnA [Candidatus Symbiothrix sp.]|jgi:phosphoesterase RecJ-like protein|nr:bifunctional oligoribonuclease/PAP phosphatase NrnA [Candidatus Symbiothrix sp.]